MAFRMVAMIEVKEVLRRWLGGDPKKRIAAQVGLDPKTVRKYVSVATSCGLDASGGPEQLDGSLFGEIVQALQPSYSKSRGPSWELCLRHRGRIQSFLEQRVRLKKVGKLLRRQGVQIPYSTLHRFAVQELRFGKAAPTVPVLDGVPGQELQVDAGLVVTLEPSSDGGKPQRKKALIFTPTVSRYRFVYPLERESTDEVIQAFEAAWTFYGGVFASVLVDNARCIVSKADPVAPQVTLEFREYSQARGFVVDTARVRKPKDKARVERSVRHTRDDCFGGERLFTVQQARERALHWCRFEDGVRRHSTTQRLPQEHFYSVEASCLKPAPKEPYDVPVWREPKVGRDHLAQVEKALYSLPTRFIGTRLQARADRSLVRFYHQGQLVKVHPRQPPGGRAIDANDFPAEKQAYVMRDVDYLIKKAAENGTNVGLFAERIFAGQLPWLQMRRVHALLRLAEKHGPERTDAACALALDVEMISLPRLKKMLELAALPALKKQDTAKIIPFQLFRRSPSDYALPGLRTDAPANQKGKEP